jgi:hypothetical protein|tara:strand:+ start:8687 stop:8920 length:234 start_codon:yes stop_codon:yes gene_type:complete
MYNLRVYLKGVKKEKDTEKPTRNTKSVASDKKGPGKTKLFNTLSFRNVAKKDINYILSSVTNRGNGEIVKHEIRLEK